MKATGPRAVESVGAWECRMEKIFFSSCFSSYFAVMPCVQM